MNLPAPFAYPTTPHTRRHGPRGYKNYKEYKPFLRDEFAFRCVYCLDATKPDTRAEPLLSRRTAAAAMNVKQDVPRPLPQWSVDA